MTGAQKSVYLQNQELHLHLQIQFSDIHDLLLRYHYIFSEEYRQKLSDAHKGHIQSEETRKKISEAFTGAKHPLYGTHRSEDTKRKISLKTRGKKVSEETRAK